MIVFRFKEKKMKIVQHLETEEHRVELSLQTIDLQTHSKFQNVNQNEVREILKATIIEILQLVK